MKPDVDVIFTINSALNVRGRSVFSNEERWEQIQGTIDSINRYCRSNIKYMFDNSPDGLTEHQARVLSRRGVTILYTGDIPIIKQLSSDITEHGIHNSICETIATKAFFDWFTKDENITAHRICKLSGRYRINEAFMDHNHYHFSENDYFYGKYVFAKAHPANSALKDVLGMTHLFCTRCWHMDYSLLPDFTNEVIPNIINDVINHRIDAEHAYYRQIPKDKVVEVNKVGLEGFISQNGDYAND